MALLFTDGFDHCGTVDVATFGKWGAGGGFSGNATARTGNAARSTITTSNMTTKVLPASGGFALGFAIRAEGAFNAGNLVIIQVQESATIHLALAVTLAGLLQVRRGGTTLQTGTTVLAANNWYHIQFKGTINDTTGSFEVKLDDVAEPNLTQTGVDTQNAGTGVWDRVLLNHYTANGTPCYFDDFTVCDLSGSAPRNTHLGMVKVETLLPQTDAVAAGTNHALVCSTGTDHGALVDENPPNTTDYNSSPTVGDKDTYNYPSMALAGTIVGVQANLYVSKSDATARTVCAVTRSASTDSDSANISPLTTFSNFHIPIPQNPNAGSPIEWTTSTVNAAEFGMKVTT